MAQQQPDASCLGVTAFGRTAQHRSMRQDGICAASMQSQVHRFPVRHNGLAAGWLNGAGLISGQPRRRWAGWGRWEDLSGGVTRKYLCTVRFELSLRGYFGAAPLGILAPCGFCVVGDAARQIGRYGFWRGEDVRRVDRTGQRAKGDRHVTFG